MNKIFAIAPLMASLITTAAFASVGSELKAGKTGLYQITKLICAEGQLSGNADAVIGQKTNSLMLADSENYGKVLQKSDDSIDSIAMVSAISGYPDGLCRNGGKPTFLIEIFQKVTR